MIVAIALALSGQNPALAQSTATIEGVVRDAATNQPLSDVRIGLSASGVAPIAYNPPGVRVPPVLVTTDSEGRFSIDTKEVGLGYS